MQKIYIISGDPLIFLKENPKMIKSLIKRQKNDLEYITVSTQKNPLPGIRDLHPNEIYTEFGSNGIQAVLTGNKVCSYRKVSHAHSTMSDLWKAGIRPKYVFIIRDLLPNEELTKDRWIQEIEEKANVTNVILAEFSWDINAVTSLLRTKTKPIPSQKTPVFLIGPTQKQHIIDQQLLSKYNVFIGTIKGIAPPQKCKKEVYETVNTLESLNGLIEQRPIIYFQNYKEGKRWQLKNFVSTLLAGAENTKSILGIITKNKRALSKQQEEWFNGVPAIILTEKGKIQIINNPCKKMLTYAKKNQKYFALA